jgi:hypothetical protein
MQISDYPKPFCFQLTGSALAELILRGMGWRVAFDGLPARQGVIAIYPHTSNWDFLVMVLVKWAVGIPVRFWGKDKLFRVPLLGRWLQWIGGVPVDRTASHGVVAQAVQHFAQARAQDAHFWLALTPEGTRKHIPGWRSGFYQTTTQAGVPLGLVALDYGRREVTIQSFITLNGDAAHDFSRIAQVYEGVRGFHAQNAAPIRLLDASVPRSETIVK